MAHNKT